MGRHQSRSLRACRAWRGPMKCGGGVNRERHIGHQSQSIKSLLQSMASVTASDICHQSQSLASRQTYSHPPPAPPSPPPPARAISCPPAPPFAPPARASSCSQALSPWTSPRPASPPSDPTATRSPTAGDDPGCRPQAGCCWRPLRGGKRREQVVCGGAETSRERTAHKLDAAGSKCGAEGVSR